LKFNWGRLENRNPTTRMESVMVGKNPGCPD
jgi:hypothetical protein